MSGRVVSAILVIAALVYGQTAIALAQPRKDSNEASKHFQRGVALYNEADYRAALVEFKKAYDLVPNATVLYNIGETYYQLQNYAQALTTLEQYLNEAGSSAAHRAEVDQTIDTLQSRVARVAVTSNITGCEITIDDEEFGKTPLRQPALVSIGVNRKVTALCPGRPAENRFTDVGPGETKTVDFTIIDKAPSAPTSGTPTNWKRIAWISTGGFGAAAITTGVLAFVAARDLRSARDAKPVAPEDAAQKAADLSHKSSVVTRWSLIADLTGVAAVVSGAIALKLTLSSSKTSEVHVALAPGGIQIAGWFP